VLRSSHYDQLGRYGECCAGGTGGLPSLGLKLPLPSPAPSLFAANALGQTSLNTQLSGTLEDLLVKVKALLSAQGH